MFNWKIISVVAKDGLITEAKYYVLADDGKQSVDTEGYWKFGDSILRVAFEDVTEEMIVGWIKNEAIQYGENIVESRLQEQLDALEKREVLPPWVPQVFTLGNK
jgi:non-ribosomal peptide synthetase component E (peptide arylation enzyme)